MGIKKWFLFSLHWQIKRDRLCEMALQSSEGYAHAGRYILENKRRCMLRSWLSCGRGENQSPGQIDWSRGRASFTLIQRVG